MMWRVSQPGRRESRQGADLEIKVNLATMVAGDFFVGLPV
jgi:hypothetical protein